MLAFLLCPLSSPPYNYIIPFIVYKVKCLFLFLQTKIEPTNIDLF
nr:MAG TPA: hypothetical protein [Caudoviricetes sp.]